MTDNEIIKALECLEADTNCCDCALYNKKECKGKCIFTNALDLINRKKAEIERLQADEKTLENVIKNSFLEKAGIDIDPLAEIKAEAVKEFAERLKEELEGEYIKATNKLENAQNIVVSTNIKIVDNLVKEMAGEKK